VTSRLVFACSSANRAALVTGWVETWATGTPHHNRDLLDGEPVSIPPATWTTVVRVAAKAWFRYCLNARIVSARRT
jgi:hypothetical protein